MSLPLATKGILGGFGGGTGPVTPPGRPCITAFQIGATSIIFDVLPPDDLDYAGTKIQYNLVGSCSDYKEAGPEVAGQISITGLEAGIYAFVPWAYDTDGAYSEPGDPVIASFPVNVIDMSQFSMDNCAWQTIWATLRGKTDSISLQTVLRSVDEQVTQMLRERQDLLQRIERLEYQVSVLNRRA